MIDFGYHIQADRQIDFNSNNRRIIRFVRSQEPSVDWCMNCGTCSSGCTAGGYSLRRMISLARRGEEKEIMENIHRCRFCGKCLNACPRNVNTRHVVFLMQLAVKKISHNEI
jgi:heterodisulfide reductase subunit C